MITACLTVIVVKIELRKDISVLEFCNTALVWQFLS